MMKNTKCYVLNNALWHKSQQKRNDKKSRLVRFLGCIVI